MSVKIPYAYSNGTLSVEVRLKHAADVFLVDTVNYHKYQKGERCDMLPPLKSLILKWGLLAQWLY